MSDVLRPALVPQDLQPDATASYWPGAPRPASGSEEEREAETVDRIFAPPVQFGPSSHEAAGFARTPGNGGNATPPPGIGGGFLLKRIVGRGGFGEVWEAHQFSLDRLVAVKLLRADRSSGSSTASRTPEERCEDFRREALTTGQLDHPNIPPVYDFGVDEFGRPLMAMKMVRGAPWSRVIREDFRRLSVADFLARHLAILVQVAQAVAFAHSRGIVHRDLKPAQVMLGEFGETLLMDWGLALIYDPTASALESPYSALAGRELSLATSPAGTPAYMAPEQTEDTASGVGPWTDVYLLGGILYQLLTGAPPHAADRAEEAFVKAMSGTVEHPLLRAGGREVPEVLAALALYALEPVPEQRLQSAREFIQELQAYLTGSGKRGQAATLLAEVSARVQEGTVAYGEYSDLLSRLADARALWPENVAVGPLTQRVLLDHARAALAHGDLALARLQAGRLDPGAEAEEIQTAIRAGEAAIRRDASQRRVLLAGVGVLLLALAAPGGVPLDAVRAEALALAARLRRTQDGDLAGGQDLMEALELCRGNLARPEIQREVAQSLARLYEILGCPGEARGVLKELQPPEPEEPGPP